MADATQTLAVQITGESSSAVAAAQEVADAYGKLTAATGVASEATGAAGKEMAATGAEAGGLAASLKILESNWRLVSAGAEAAGVEIVGAGVKIAALTDIVEGAEAAFAPLIVVLAAVAAAGAAFDFFKEGVKDAADFQKSMTAIETSLGQTGKAWTATSDQIKEYLETQERATGYDSNEVLASMTRLITAGASLKDAEYEMAVASDVAAAKNIDLASVTNALIEAEAGRAQGLARLDPQLRGLIKSHADLFTILQQLEQDMSGQAAAAADTYAGAVRRLSADWDSFRRDIGSWLIPWLTQTVDGFIGLGDQLQAIGRDLQNIAQLKGAPNESAASAGARAIGQLGKDVFGFGDTSARGRQDAVDAQRKRQEETIDATRGLDFDPIVGNEPKGKKQAPATSRRSRARRPIRRTTASRTSTRRRPSSRRLRTRKSTWKTRSRKRPRPLRCKSRRWTCSSRRCTTRRRPKRR